MDKGNFKSFKVPNCYIHVGLLAVKIKCMHREQLICKFGSQFYHQTLVVEQCTPTPPKMWSLSTPSATPAPPFSIVIFSCLNLYSAITLYWQLPFFAIMQVSISSITIPPGHDLKGAKPLPRDNHSVQKPSPLDNTGSQKPHPQDIKLENFTLYL